MHGFTVPINTEYMLIFGGMTSRDITFNASGTDSDPNEKQYDIFNYCEQYTEITGKNLTEFLRTCGEELLNDIWIYDILNDIWTHLKPGTNYDEYLDP